MEVGCNARTRHHRRSAPGQDIVSSVCVFDVTRQTRGRLVDDPFRSRPLVTLSSAPPRAGNFKFDYKLPAFSLPLRVSVSTPSRVLPFPARFAPPPLALSPSAGRHPTLLTRARPDEKTPVARLRRNYWPAGFIYGVHFPKDRGRCVARCDTPGYCFFFSALFCFPVRFSFSLITRTYSSL